MSNTADKVINVANNEVGYIEKATNAFLYDKTANPGKNNWTKYGEWIKVNGNYWCASFISWCFNQAYGSAGKTILGTYSASCETIRGKVTPVPSPTVGDLVFFKGTRHAGANHIALIYYVDDKNIYTIEGNTSGKSGVVDNGGEVARKQYKKTYSKILSYGRPRYDLPSSSTHNDKPTIKNVVKVSSGTLNVRNKPVDGEVLKRLSNGTELNIIGYDNGWYQLDKDQWVSADYVKTAHGTVTATTLNMRKGSDKTCDIIALLKKNQTVNVLGEENDFYLVCNAEKGIGWASKKYIDLV